MAAFALGIDVNNERIIEKGDDALASWVLTYPFVST